MLRKRIMTVLALYYFINTQGGNKIFDYAAKLSKQEREEFYVSLSRYLRYYFNFISEDSSLVKVSLIDSE